MASRILILGGSTEGFALADTLAQMDGFEPVTSFAGRTRSRRPVAGASRIGGFGGADGLRDYLVRENFSALIDATHPFAQKISQNAQKAALAAKIPLLRIERPPWRAGKGDDWRPVADMQAAAKAIPQLQGRVFLTIGRTRLAPFAARDDIHFIARVIDAPEDIKKFSHLELVFARGPFDIAAERAFFAEHQIACLVSKNSGGAAAAAKLQIARERAIPVIMIERPKPPGGKSCTAVDEAINWLREQNI